MVFSNFIVVAVTRGSRTVLERVGVLGVKMFLSSKSESRSIHIRVPIARENHQFRDILPPLIAVGVDDQQNTWTGERDEANLILVVIKILRIGRLPLGASKLIPTELQDPLDASANLSTVAVREST